MSKSNRSLVKKYHWLRALNIQTEDLSWMEFFPKGWRISFGEQMVEDSSFTTCIVCGKPAEYLTKGWVLPICRSCAKELKYQEGSLSPIKKN